MVAAVLPNGVALTLGSSGWTIYYCGPLQTIPTSNLGTHVISVFDGSIDASAVGTTGTKILVGYGLDAADCLAKKKYLNVYTIN
jgi:hypothetical protein